MAVIEKGKYRWNNVLSVPYDELIVPIKLKCSATFLEDGVFYSGVCDAIRVSPYNDNRDVYMRVRLISAEPITNNVDTMPFYLSVYDSGAFRDFVGWNKLFSKDLKYFTLEEDCDVPDDFHVWFRYNTKKIKDGDTADSAKARVKSLIRKINKETGKEHSNLSDGVETLVLGFGVDKTEVFDGNIELEGEFEPGEPKITDYYEEGYNKGYSEGLEAGGGSCSNKNIIEVDELPTDNIDKDAVYQITKKTLTEIVEVANRERYVVKRNGCYEFIPGEPYLVSNLIYEPTRPTQNIQESYGKTWCIYYIEDENNLFIYKHGEWCCLDPGEHGYKGVISDVKEATENGVYAVVTEQKSFYQINSEPFGQVIYKDGQEKIYNFSDLAAKEGDFLIVRIVPTRPTENIIESTPYYVCLYFFEDERNVALYSESSGWEEGDADVDIIFSPDEATETDRFYVLYQKWNKYIETSGYLDVIENGTYNVENVENVIVDIPNKAINGVWNFNVADDGWIDLLQDEDYELSYVNAEVSWDVNFSCVFNGEVAHFIGIWLYSSYDGDEVLLQFKDAGNEHVTVASGSGGSVFWCGTEQFPTDYTMSTTIDFGDEPQIVPELFMSFMAQTAIRQEAGGSYEDGKAEGRAEAEAEVKPVLLNAIELQDVLLVRPVDENSPLEDVIYEFEDTAIRAKLNVKMYVREPGIESSTYYDNQCIKAVKASAPNFWISSDGIAIEPYFVILSTGTLTVEYANGRILEVFDPTGTLTQDNFINEETGSEVEVHNLYSPSSGESKLSADKNGFVWYVSDEECFLCDYIGKARSITLPASCNGREYSFWKKALSGLRVDYIHIPKELKNFSGDAFCVINPFGNDIYIVIDDPGDWCEKSFMTNLDHPRNIGARLYCNGEVIKSINVPEDIITIGKYLLYQNGDIESVIMHDKVIGILNYAFYGCTNLKSITIPDSVATISGYAFASSGLENFVFPKSIRELGGFVLQSCKSLKSLTVYGNKISSSMCTYCSALTDIIFNDNITTIDGNAFYGCSAITNVTVNGTIKIDNNNLRLNGSSRLTVESMVNIMNALESNVGGTQYTVYFGTVNLNKLTAAQKAIATNKNIKLA